jgi:hypothetical protein
MMAGQFCIHSDSNLSSLTDFIAEIQTLPNDLRQDLGVTSSDKQIQFVLFGSDSEFRRYMQHYFPQVPVRRALFIKDRGPGFVFAYRHADLSIDLRHECTHALLQEAVGPIPLWLDEGLAEYYEMPASQRRAHTTHLHDVQYQMSLGNIRSIASLESITDISKMRDTDYRDAWAWVHFLLHGTASGREILQAYLRDVAARRSTPPLSVRVQQAMPMWRDDLAGHFRRPDIERVATAPLGESIIRK